MTTEDFLERIAVELHELNTTLNCRFDALDGISDQLKDINDSLGAIHLSVGDLDSIQKGLWEVKSAIEDIRV